MISDTDDAGLPPPLEDMTREIEKFRKTRNFVVESPKLRDERPKTAPKRTVDNTSLLTEEEKAAKPDEIAKPKESFGFKKGFLTVGSSKKGGSETKQIDGGKKRVDPVPVIRPKQTKEESLQFEQVQKAMAANMSFLEKGDWRTPDFISRVTSNELLSKAMQNPDFQKAVDLFSTNPTQALAQYGHRPEIMQPLREYMGLMGDHLENFSEETSKVRQTTHEPMVPKDLPAHEQELVKRVMADKAVQDILRDPKFQKILAGLQKNPGEAIRYMNHPDSDIRSKIRKLVEVGLLQIVT